MRLLLLLTMLTTAPLSPDEWWKVPETKAYGDYYTSYASTTEPSRFQVQQDTWFNLLAGRFDLNIKSKTTFMNGLIETCEVSGAQQYQGDSLGYILKSASAKQVLMFNEAHSLLRQRYFLYQNLERFWHAGYRHIGYEAIVKPFTGLDDFDHVDEQQGYLNEPLFAATVRKALEIGFKVFAYEARDHQYDRQAAFNERMLGREQAQALNIASYLSEVDEGEGILIWAGYRHISRKRSENDVGMMAHQLEQIHGISTYTVELTGCAVATGNIDEGPHLYMNGGKPMQAMGQTSTYVVDAQLHLPEVLNPEPGLFRSVLGTPIYLASEDRQLSGTLFLQAYKPGQPEQAVPYDAVFMFEGENLPVYLPTGEFELRLYGSDGGLLKTVHHSVE